MSKIKLCGLSRKCDIEWANALKPEYIGFVFWSKSKRNVPPEKAKELKDSANSLKNTRTPFLPLISKYKFETFQPPEEREVICSTLRDYSHWFEEF